MLSLIEIQSTDTSIQGFPMKNILLISIVFALLGCSDDPEIQQQPDPFTDTRHELIRATGADSKTAVVRSGHDRLIISLPLGFTSTIQLFESGHPNGKLFIFHSGHAKNPKQELESYPLIDALLADGYDVAWIQMPLMSLNERPGSCAIEDPAAICLPCYYATGQLCQYWHDTLWSQNEISPLTF